MPLGVGSSNPGNRIALMPRAVVRQPRGDNISHLVRGAASEWPAEMGSVGGIKEMEAQSLLSECLDARYSGSSSPQNSGGPELIELN